MKQIKNVADVLVSTVDKKSYTDQLPVRLINYTDVYYGETLTPADARMNATATRDQLSNFRLRAGDSILTKDSETADDIGVSAYLAESADDVVCGYHLAILRPRVGAFPKFLYWCLKSEVTRGQFSNLANGMTRYGLTTGAIKSTTVPNPALEEQQRIADFLDDQVARIDNIIAARRSQQLFVWKAVYSAMESRLTIADSSQGVEIRRLIESEQLGAWGNEPTGDGATDFGVARVADFRRDTFVLGKVETRRALNAGQLATRRLSHGDTLLERSGGSPKKPVGCAVFVEEPGSQMVCSNFVSRLRPRSDVDGRYLSLVLGALYSGGRQRPHSTQTTGIQNLDSHSYLSLRVPAMSHVDQVAEAKSLDTMLIDAERGTSSLGVLIDGLNEMKRSLITAAITGKFDVTTADGSRVPV